MPTSRSRRSRRNARCCPYSLKAHPTIYMMVRLRACLWHETEILHRSGKRQSPAAPGNAVKAGTASLCNIRLRCSSWQPGAEGVKWSYGVGRGSSSSYSSRQHAPCIEKQDSFGNRTGVGCTPLVRQQRCQLGRALTLGFCMETMILKEPGYDPLLRAVGRVVQDKRLSMGISQEELARRARLHRTYVSDVERGSRSVSLITLCKLAEALDTEASHLISLAEHIHQMK